MCGKAPNANAADPAPLIQALRCLFCVQIGGRCPQPPAFIALGPTGRQGEIETANAIAK